MATNQTGIAIVIKAWLPAGKTLDEQFNALSIVKTAHETGDYAPLLAAANVEEVKTEQRTRRMEDHPEPQPATQEDAIETVAQASIETVTKQNPLLSEPEPTNADDEGVPQFLKKGKSKAA